MNISRMGRGVLMFALLLALFALVAPPRQATRKPNEAPGQNIATTRQVAAAVEQKAQASEYQRPCRKHEDNRSSDLCAQWKAADAAESAADAAWHIGLAGAFLGFLTLIVAVKAALYARDAANQTKRGAITAQDALDHQRVITSHSHRAYLDLDDAAFRRWPEGDDDGGFGYKATVKLRNYGQTPAQNVLCRNAIFRLSQQPSFKIVKTRALQRLNRVAPSDWANLKDVIDLDFETIEAIKGGEGGVWWIVHFYYSDIFDKRYEQGVIYGLDADFEWYLVEQHSEKEIKV